MGPPATNVSLVINVTSFIIVSYGLYLCSSIQLPPSLREAGHKQFLTNISAAFTILNNFSNVVNFSTQKAGLPAGFISFWARHVTLPVALVLESVVASVYWPLRLFAMHLIMVDTPEKDRSPIPLRVDLAIHLAPITFLLCDHYLSGAGARFRVPTRVAWPVVVALGFAYKALLEGMIDPDAGQAFPYPFLNVREPIRSVIFATVTSFSLVFYMLYQKKPPSSVQMSVKVE